MPSSDTAGRKLVSGDFSRGLGKPLQVSPAVVTPKCHELLSGAEDFHLASVRGGMRRASDGDLWGRTDLGAVKQ